MQNDEINLNSVEQELVRTFVEPEKQLEIVEFALTSLEEVKRLFLDGWSYTVTSDQVSRVVEALKELLPEEPCCCDKCLEEINQDISEAINHQQDAE